MERNKEKSDIISELQEKIKILEKNQRKLERSRTASFRRHDRNRIRHRARSQSSRSWSTSRSASSNNNYEYYDSPIRSRSPLPASRSRSVSKTRSLSSSPIIVIETEDSEKIKPFEPDAAVPAAKSSANTKNSDKEDVTQASELLSEDILALLGDAPEEVAFGPNLLTQLCSRWQDLIKKGMSKEDRDKIMKKYPPPENCKIIGAPKMNPEAQAAAGETLVHRDRAIEMKQNEVSCALTAIGLALNKLCVVHGNEEIIALLSDSARLLCDYQHRESQLRKMFIVSGIDNKMARESLKDCDVDQWLFGEDLAEKLKASKAIERSSKDLKNTRRPKKIQTGNLNFKGSTNNTYKPRARGGQKQHHQRKQSSTYSSAKAHRHHQQKGRTQRHYNHRH